MQEMLLSIWEDWEARDKTTSSRTINHSPPLSTAAPVIDQLSGLS